MKCNFRALLMAGTALSLAAGSAVAQDDAAEEVIEELVVTGTPGRSRSVMDSPVAIDVFGSDDIQDISFVDTQNIVQNLVPSFNVNRAPIADGASFIRQANLRGLPADKTLILVNSKRRHRAALVTIGGNGSQGPDIATIPSIAIKNIEVLRDGAAAQYGSDAIAGVINFILHDAPEGGRITAQAGAFYEGDGNQLLGQVNLGFGLGENGFINISAEGTYNDGTSRGVQHPTALQFLEQEGPGSAFANRLDEVNSFGVVQVWGQPPADAFRAFVNSGYKVSDQLEFYAFANYSTSQANTSFFYRNPANSILGPSVRQPDGSLFSFSDILPAGFTPRFTGEVTDFSLTAGLRGQLTDWLYYDITGRTGENKIDYTIASTLNPSLGPTSPSRFEPGSLKSDESEFTADFTAEFDVGAASPMYVKTGVTYRDEGYNITSGDPLSFAVGPYANPDPWDFCNDDGTATAAGAAVAGLNCADPSDPVNTVLAVGSNGFPGYSSEFAGGGSRDSYGAYIDAEVNITEEWLIGGSFRYEDFSDFGDTSVFQLRTRYQVTDGIALRGSVGEGFRAPTPGQLFTTNVSTRINDEGNPVATGLFPANNPVSLALGSQPLRPETTFQFTLGLVAELTENWDITIDYYNIEIDDQFFGSDDFTVDDALRADLIANNVPGARTIGEVNFFTNAFKSTTQGFDIVTNYSLQWDEAGETDISLSFNYNEFSVDEVNDPTLFSAEQVFDFENNLPDWRAILNVTHSYDKWRFLARANVWGPYAHAFNSDFSTPDNIQNFSEELMVDLEVAYQLTEQLQLALGARNVFDNYPDPGLFEAGQGRVYRSDSVVDWQGGYYYARINFTF